MDLSHLKNTEVQQQARLSDGERRLIIQKTHWFDYPRAEAIFDHMEWLFAHARNDRMPNLHIIAEPMSGKSRILKRFAEELHPAVIDPRAEADIRPVVYLEAPAKPSAKGILEEILLAINAPFPSMASPTRLMSSVDQLFRAIGVKMLIIDEIQHILRGSPVKQREMRDQIKLLGNKLRMPIIASGIPESSGAFSSDTQLSTRFKPMRLPRWSVDQEEDVKHLMGILRDWQNKCPLRKPSNLLTPQIVQRIFEATGGLLGHVVDYLKLASEYAMESHTECITEKTLTAMAWTVPKEAKPGYLAGGS